MLSVWSEQLKRILKMNKRDRIKWKKQSRKKWDAIVQDLRDNSTGEFDFTTKSCGYCQVYLPNADGRSYGDVDFSFCKNCPLNKKSLCWTGYGRAYQTVSNFYIEQPTENARMDHTEQSQTLKQAGIMLRAITKDIEQETT